ncbi:MAG: hypothetical protein GEU28_01535 [Dehalococcoidia bacterium]|nr:hypothetical protein [Dehalococcoidia bacterium]
MQNVRVLPHPHPTDGYIQLLVDMDEARSLFDRIAFIQEVSDLLAVEVHAFDGGGLDPRFRRTMESEAIAL